MARSRDKGFTLIEVLLALGLFAIAVASLPTVLITNARANALARRLTTATSLAQDEIEIIRNTKYIDVASGSDSPTDPTDMSMVYTRIWTVSDGPTDGTRNLAVVVSWTDQAARQVEIDAIIGS